MLSEIREYLDKSVIKEIRTVNVTLSTTTSPTTLFSVEKKEGYRIVIHKIGVDRNVDLSNVTLYIKAGGRELSPNSNGWNLYSIGSIEKPTEFNLVIEKGLDAAFKYTCSSGTPALRMLVEILYVKEE